MFIYQTLLNIKTAGKMRKKQTKAKQKKKNLKNT